MRLKQLNERPAAEQPKSVKHPCDLKGDRLFMALHKKVLITALALVCCGLTGCGTKSTAKTCERLRTALGSIRSSDAAAYTWLSPSDMENPYTVYTNGKDYYAVRLVDGTAVQEQPGRGGKLYSRLPVEETVFTDTGSAAGDLPGLHEGDITGQNTETQRLVLLDTEAAEVSHAGCF